jgi:hypothetical protein
MPARRRDRHARGAALHGRCATALLLLAAALHPPTAGAIEAIEIEARSIEVAGIRASDLRLRLELPRNAPAGARGPLRSVVTAAELDLGPETGRYGALRLTCPDTRLDEPEFGCDRATLTAAVLEGALLPPVAAQLRLGWNLDSGALAARGVWTLREGVALRFAASQRGGAWRADASLPGADLAALRAWLGPVLGLPEEIAVEGRLDAHLNARGGARIEQGRLEVAVRGLNFSNDAGTLVGENVGLQVTAVARPRGGGRVVEVTVDSAAGQALFGPALLDLAAHPLALRGRGSWGAEAIVFDDVAIAQRNLSDARATATLQISPALVLREAEIDLRELRLPQAYTAYAQIALAATDFGALETRGRITGSARIRDNALVSADARLLGLEIEDTRGKFSMTNLRGQLHWAPAGRPVEDSVLTWTAGSAYGLSGDGARIDFRAQGSSLALTRPARLPIFDGALLISTLTLDAIGSPNPALQFEADIEPISLQRLAPAFGWPELAGKLSGRIPRIDFRDRMLTVAGDVEARVFGGRIVGSGLRLQDPLGPWPRLFADVRAYDLDLAEVTQTFSIGSITGRLEGHLLGLELFNWSPVAFDALLQTPPRDRSPHRISARAIGNLSNIGGGGGGVFQTLQSGALQFFDEYNYDRVGLRCRLANDVCLMSGIQPTGTGYYILKGKGLPHIDIIGNAGRVSWPQLVSQIATQMRGEGKLRIE